VLKKLNLDGTKIFETTLACSVITNMVDALLAGHNGDRRIGSEQGISKWDDFVIEAFDGTLTHVQAKRNNKDFSNHGVTRGTITKGSNKGSLYALSPLDESLKSLADWVNTVDLQTLTPKRKFKLEIAEGQIQIKEGITINDFRILCNDHIKDITTDILFANLIATDKKVASIVEWLKNWCDFKDANHVLRGLKLLKVYSTGNVPDIKLKCVERLTSKFNQPQDVYDRLAGYINDNMTFTTAITPRIALDKLQSFLLPNILSWTQYQKLGTAYQKNGTHDLSFGNIETPSIVVTQLWDKSKPGIIKLDAPVNISEKLPQAIVRLTLHLQSGAMAHLTNHDAWKEAVKAAVGGTLGIDKSDFNTINSMQCPGISLGSDSASLTSLTDQDQEADALNDEMQKAIWVDVCESVFKEFASHENTPLRVAVENRWGHWKRALDIDFNAQKKLCVSMLHPVAEGKDILAHLRVGPKTTGLIATGIFTLLVVSVCLDGFDDLWDKVGSELTVTTNAMGCWSGAHGEPRRPRKLTENGREKLLAANPAKILILSEVESAPSELRNITLADDVSQHKNLAAAHEPQIIVTMCPKFSDLVRQGVIGDIKSYLESQITNQ
jgi:hypothetical protein